MATTATVEKQKLTFVRLPKIKKKDAQFHEQPLTKEEFLQILKDGDERFARGEYKTDVWALEERLRERVRQHYQK